MRGPAIRPQAVLAVPAGCGSGSSQYSVVPYHVSCLCIPQSAAWLRGLVLLTTAAASGVFAVSAAFFTEDSSWGRQPFLPRGLLGVSVPPQ